MSSTRFEPLSLTTDFRNCLALFEYTSDSYFVTGKAGTGKSTLLQLFKDTTRKKIAVVAPTGIAALHVRGQTIHSFFGFPPYPLRKNQIHKVPHQRLYQHLEVLVIDEISMVRADMLDQIDYFLRLNRDNSEPFGGLQLICFGDLYQLPPVLASISERQALESIYETPYFYSASVFQTDFEIKMIELNHVYRQEEYHFIQLLDKIRTRNFDYDDLEELNFRSHVKTIVKDNAITLSTTNAIAERINSQNLQLIDHPLHTYHAEIEGEFGKNSYPTDLVLVLKEGAQIMFVRNDPSKEFVNGSIGKIVKLGENFISIELDQFGKSKMIQLQPMEWHIIKYKLSREKEIEAEVVGLFRQYPIKLAWAITIHKSQGKTFDKINIDLGHGAFEFGQTYVALSRCRTLNGIVLNRPLHPNDILVDPRINEFYESKKKVPLSEFKPWIDR
ncbi:MAG: AAA family ATPase [Saprospiraceae bacterium]